MIENLPQIIRRYLDLENDIEIEEIKILNNFFKKINNYELKSGNILYNGLINDGLVMIPCIKRKKDNIDNEIKISLIKNLNKKIKEENDIKIIYFYKTLSILIDNINYITEEEQVLFNFLFDELIEKKVKNIGKQLIIK
ncbi:MAG: hypothetical protein J6K21_01985 [Bacilli bacterium]|nr:hypothetical protein [Bacilli bacterium]